VAIFTPDERERLRGELITAAQKDPNLCGAAHTGSGASSRLDRWSDIDLALCLKPGPSYDRVVAEWTELLYRHHGAVAHVDVMRGSTLFRVFLLENTLQVDVAFWRTEDFAATGPNFLLIFGQAKPPQHTPPPTPVSLIGMAWLYALHVRSSLARGRILQAEYMLSGMRNHVCELLALRCGVTPHQGRESRPEECYEDHLTTPLPDTWGREYARAALRIPRDAQESRATVHAGMLSSRDPARLCPVLTGRSPGMRNTDVM
jgi:hypothetical protein